MTRSSIDTNVDSQADALGSIPEGFGCRSCGSGRVLPILSLGSTPLANRLLTEQQIGEPEPTYPLDLVFCPNCALVQITETVPPEELFSEYVYFSSVSSTLLDHAREIAERMVRDRHLGRDSLVVEPASNDGYLLRNYQAQGVPVLGVEPARNVAGKAGDSGIPTRNAFFGRDVGRALAAEGKQADVLHANNVLAHVADLNGFVAGIAAVLKPEGIASIEAPYVRQMIDRVEFDTIYHEHLCYFSLTALDHLFARHGLAIVDVEELSIHGGSLRVFAQREVASGRQRSDRFKRMRAEEQQRGLDQVEYYRDFARRVSVLRDSLREMLGEIAAAGKAIAGYGAPAKGNTLLNYAGIGREMLRFISDNTPSKQGRYTPGTHIPIVPPERFREERPDYALLLAWNFEEEILKKEAAYRRAGGRFIIPVPEPRIV